MDYVISTDRRSRRLAWLWWLLAAYNLLLLVGHWLRPLEGLTGRLAILTLPTFIVILATDIEWRGGAHTRVGRVLYVTLLAVVVWMYVSMGSDLLSWQAYVSPYLIMPFLAVLLPLCPTMPLLRSYYSVVPMFSFIGMPIALLSAFVHTDKSLIQFIFETFILGAGLLLLTARYHSTRTVVWSVVTLAIGIVAAALTARRNLMLTAGLYMLIGGIQLVFGSTIRSLANRLFLVITVSVVVLAGVFFYMSNAHGMFGLISERASENTREYVFLHFFMDIGSDTSSLMLGRSLTGTYECPGVESGEQERQFVECGYLQDVLKGGLLYLVVYLTIVGYAIVRGMRGRNQLLHAAAWLLVVQLIDMIAFGIHAFNTKTFMLWMAVAVCMDRSLWMLNDDEVRRRLYQPCHKTPEWNKTKNSHPETDRTATSVDNV